MATQRSEFTEILKRLLRVQRHEVETEERKWQEEQAREKSERKRSV